MADLATPSAATMSTIDAKADAPPAKAQVSKPERPDDDSYKKELAAAEKELDAVKEKQKQIKAKLDLAQPKNQDSPTYKRRTELIEERNQIRTQQQSGKASRGSVLDKIKRLDEQLKSMLAEQKSARSKVPYKSVEEIDQQITRLQNDVDTGRMKIVDEKKALAEVSQLNKQKRGFAGFDDAQKRIDGVKAQIGDLRKGLDDPESKAMSDRYTAISAELDSIKAEQDEAYKSLNSLRDQRTKINDEQQVKWQAVKDIKDKYYQARRAAAEYEKEAYRIRKDKQRQEREAFEAGKRKQVAQAKLEEASAPAYQDLILSAQGLIRYFDPASAGVKTAAEPGKFAAQASRTVEDSGFKGTKLARKGDDEENYFIGGGGKKGKKGQKGRDSPAPSTPSASDKFNINMGVIEDCAKVGVEPPSNQSEVPGVVEKLKEKLEHWKSDQDRKTKENIAKAQKEIERLEAETSGGQADSSTNGTTDAGNKTAAKAQGVNGDVSAGAEADQGKDAADNVSNDLAATKIEDDAAPES